VEQGSKLQRFLKFTPAASTKRDLRLRPETILRLLTAVMTVMMGLTRKPMSIPLRQGRRFTSPRQRFFCGRELATSPSRVKLNIYGYTWGSKWATDTSGQEYFFYRVRLCFSRIQDWYINQARRGEGILGTGQEVEVLDFQQEGGGTFGYWFPKFYWTGNHLNCTFADLLWDLPKWACPMGQFGAVRVTASHAGDTCDGEGTDGVVLNIGFDLDHVGTKDRWFMYSMEVNLTGSVTFAVVGASARLRPLMLAPLYLVLLFRKL